MSSKSSNALPMYSPYELGKYVFTARTGPSWQSGHTMVYITCECGEQSATSTADVAGNPISWTVEANGTSADVYVLYSKGNFDAGVLSNATHKPTGIVTGVYNRTSLGEYVHSSITYSIDGQLFHFLQNNGGKIWKRTLYASENSGAVMMFAADEVVVKSSGSTSRHRDETYAVTDSFTYDGKTVYYGTMGTANWNEVSAIPSIGYAYPSHLNIASAAYEIIYGAPESTEGNDLIARFAIDLSDAGGTGSDSDWEDPEDESEDPENTYTLNIDVEGASSGRHNDPLHDTSYSYTPADKNTRPNCGCGGDGGSGGGGGGGASTVIIKNFATSMADSKEIVIRPQRHGYGSGGGKGGKGGDGCILIYY